MFVIDDLCRFGPIGFDNQRALLVVQRALVVDEQSEDEQLRARAVRGRAPQGVQQCTLRCIECEVGLARAHGADVFGQLIGDR